MFQPIEEFHQVPTSVDDVVITVRLTKHTRDVQRRADRASRRSRPGRSVRLESVNTLDEPETILAFSYAVYDQDGLEMARGGGRGEDVLTEQEIGQLEKAARRIYAAAEKEILGK